jgi:hypothetical protein
MMAFRPFTYVCALLGVTTVMKKEEIRGGTELSRCAVLGRGDMHASLGLSLPSKDKG